MGMSTRARRSRLGVAALGFAFAALAGIWVTGPADAAEAPQAAQAPTLTDDFSAADQYVESVPTARGPKVPGVGKQRDRAGRSENAAPTLSPEVRSSLERQSDETAGQLG